MIALPDIHAEEGRRFRPRAGQLYVEFLKPADRTAGGVYLPQRCQENASEARVIAAGPGRYFADSGRTARLHVLPGDVVLLRPQDFRPMSATAGTCDMEDVLGVVDPESGEVSPRGEWCRLALAPRATETAGGLLIPEESRRRQACGVVQAEGGGRLIRRGKLAALRLSCYNLARDCQFHLEDDERPTLVGRTAYWDMSTKHPAEALQVGREFITHLLVRASELVAVED